MMNKRKEHTNQGWAHYDKYEFLKEMNDWINSVAADVEPGEDLEEILYWEMIDWLHDNIVEEQDDMWYYPVEAKVSPDGGVNVVFELDKP